MSFEQSMQRLDDIVKLLEYYGTEEGKAETYENLTGISDR